jgi:hypothetical protein
MVSFRRSLPASPPLPVIEQTRQHYSYSRAFVIILRSSAPDARAVRSGEIRMDQDG